MVRIGKKPGLLSRLRRPRKALNQEVPELKERELEREIVDREIVELESMSYRAYLEENKLRDMERGGELPSELSAQRTKVENAKRMLRILREQQARKK